MGRSSEIKEKMRGECEMLAHGEESCVERDTRRHGVEVLRCVWEVEQNVKL